jgi:hypothetical protein
MTDAVYSTYDTEDGELTYRVAIAPGGGPCGTCNGTGESLMRGEAHRGYDAPDYWDTCAICGGEGYEPSPMVVDAFPDEPLPEGWHWATQAELDEINAARDPG